MPRPYRHSGNPNTSRKLTRTKRAQQRWAVAKATARAKCLACGDWHYGRELKLGYCVKCWAPAEDKTERPRS
jgi:hypothetical protein